MSGKTHQTRAQMALEALNLLLDLADHKDICIALQRNMHDFCDWEKPRAKRYAELIRLLYGGKNARPKRPGETSGECPTNVWFDEKALEKAKSRGKA